MEFVDLSRYVKVHKPKIAPFSYLRNMKKLWLTQELKLSDRPGNKEYAEQLGKDSMAVVSILREPLFAKYLNRKTFPRRILFEMTNRCNYSCRMCPQQNMSRPRIDIDGGLYRKVVDEIDHYGVEGLWLYDSGESILHPEFRKNVDHISTKKHLGVIWMSTNGEKFTEDIARFVINSKIDWINYSAHAVTEETYKTLIPQGNFTLVQNNLKKLYELKGKGKPFIHCQMIEQETTKHETDAFIKAHYRKADLVSINMLEFCNLPNNAFGFIQRNRKELTSCFRIDRNDCIIHSNGVVSVCDVDYNAGMGVGNINQNTLFDIWNGPLRKHILNLNAQGRMNELELCKTCTDYDI